MNTTRYFGAGWLLAGLWMLAQSESVSAQILISYERAAPPARLNSVALRPNVAQPLFFHYVNPGPGAKPKVKITLEQVMVDGAGKELGVKEIGSTTLTKVVKDDNPLPVILTPTGTPGAPPPPKADPAKGEPAGTLLSGPPFLLRFWIEDANKKTKTDVPVSILEPRHYIKVADASYDATRRRLSIRLLWEDPQDPPCPVELDLQQSVIPGLIPPKAGTFRQTLSKENRTVELTAENIEFVGGVAPQNGRVYVTVDGCKRAFMYKCTFGEGLLVPLREEMRARIVTPRYSLPGPEVKAVLEIDARSLEEGEDDSPQRALVDLEFDRVGDGTYIKVPGSPFRGLREQAISYRTVDNVLVLQSRVADRGVILNTEGINGKRYLRLKLLTAREAVIPIADEQDQRDEKVALFNEGPENRFAPLRFVKDKSSIIAEVVLDGTPAEIVKFDNLPPSPEAGGKFLPNLRVKDRTPDQAPVSRVVFFYGDVDKDGKLPEKSPLVEAYYDKTLKAWVAREELLIPAEQKGRLELSAHVSTAAGVFAAKKEVLLIQAAGAAAAAKANVLTTIQGIVLRGSLRQPDAVVYLAKAKPGVNDVPAKTQTNATGAFQFTEVEPGNYTIVAVRQGTVARFPVNVPKGKDKIGVLELFLKAP